MRLIVNNLLSTIVMLCLLGCGNTEPFKQAMLTFRFDDGYNSQYTALKELNKRAIKGTLYCITGSISTRGYMTWKQVKELSRYNEIGSHTQTHPLLTFFGRDRHYAETVGSFLLLQKKGFLVKSFAYPYGWHNPFYNSQIKAFYHCAATYGTRLSQRFNGKGTDRYFINTKSPKTVQEFCEYLDTAVKKKLWYVASFHHINGRGEFNIPINEFIKMAVIAELYLKKGKIKVVTITEGCFYLRP